MRKKLATGLLVLSLCSCGCPALASDAEWKSFMYDSMKELRAGQKEIISLVVRVGQNEKSINVNKQQIRDNESKHDIYHEKTFAEWDTIVATNDTLNKENVLLNVRELTVWMARKKKVPSTGMGR